MTHPKVAAWLVLLFASLQCVREHRPTAAAQPAPATTAKSDPPLQLLSTSYVLGKCPDAKTMNSKAAESAMRGLVHPCNGGVGLPVHFLATLVPGGRIELAPPNDAGESLVPTCLLRHGLSHNVTLKEPCEFEVKLQEQPVARPGTATVQ